MRWVAVILGTLLVAGMAMLWMRHVRREKEIERNEREAVRALATLAKAERLFWNDDLNDNLVPDYWTADVRGLHLPRHFGGLIPAGIAAADATHAGARPYRGYLFVSVASDSTRGFGFCAYPARYGTSGRWTYYVSESSPVFGFDTRK